MIEKLLENKDKCILHITVTGFGGTKIEPFVPTPEKNLEHIKTLIENGFPVEQIVLRIDPIMVTQRGTDTALGVLELFKTVGIKRVRLSFMDMYNHTKERFKENNVPLPYETFHANENVRKHVFNILNTEAIKMGYSIVQTCGEPGFENTPCISQMDIDILGLTESIKLEGKKEQRSTCGCPANKRQLISWEKSKVKCGHKCLYCYMK
jgi:DNA repair photolyase